MGKAAYMIQGNPRKLTADLSAEILQERNEWQYTYLKRWKEKNLQPMLLFSARISLRRDGETKNFTEKQTEGEFTTMQQLYNKG